MKVSGKGNGPHTHGTLGTKEGADASRTAKASPLEGALDAKDVKQTRAGGAATTELSSRAQDMSKAKALATPEDGVDEAKVARLQKMIDEGRYKIDAEAIADRMVDEHSKMP